jgi:hypothetical protein
MSSRIYGMAVDQGCWDALAIECIATLKWSNS